jgi:hypothetical protein
MQLGAGGSWAGRAPGLRATITGSRLGWPVGRCGGRRRSSAGGPPCGLRAGMPRPWRAKALRSDGQVVPNSAAAALTLPSRSASWKARSASAGRQRMGWAASPGVAIVLVGVPELRDALVGCRRAGVESGELLADLPLVAVQLPASWPGRSRSPARTSQVQ